MLYALLAMSATHLLRTTTQPSNGFGELLASRDRYFANALAQQRGIVETLIPENLDEASFAALLISLNAFSMLRERSLRPYSPPMDWLEMGHGAGVVMRQAAQMLEDSSPDLLQDSKARQIIETTMPIHQNFEPHAVDENTIRPYKRLLQRLTDTGGDLTDAEEIESCVQAVKVVATLRKAVQAGEPEYVHLRRICMFPFLITAKFIDLVRDRRPSALVTLAHFFSAIASTEALTYLSNAGAETSASTREVVAIHEHVPEQWHSLLIWPMDEIRANP